MYCPSTIYLFVGCLTFQQHACESQNLQICSILHAATLRYKLHIKLCTSPSHSILTPDWPVPALTLYHQLPGRVATGELFCLNHWYNLTRKYMLQAGFKPSFFCPWGKRLSHKANEAVFLYQQDNYSHLVAPTRYYFVPLKEGQSCIVPLPAKRPILHDIYISISKTDITTSIVSLPER